MARVPTGTSRESLHPSSVAPPPRPKEALRIVECRGAMSAEGAGSGEGPSSRPLES
jgi:hypothetical protein